jgi:hypothetical protein
VRVAVEEPTPATAIVEFDEEPEPPKVEEVAPLKEVAPIQEVAAAPAALPEQFEIAYVSPIHRELCDTVDRIVSAYDGAEVPPAVTELRQMIVEAQFDQVRGEITNIWNNLLKYHQRTGTRLQHQVTTTFNTINTLVRKLD